MAGEIDRGHDDDDGQELQANPPAHEFLAGGGAAAAHHVPKAEAENDGNGTYGDGSVCIQKSVHGLS